MSKKLFLSVASLLATAAFVVMPASALAAPHWFKSGTIVKEGVVVQTITWGTLSLHSAAGELTCKNIDAGDIENPVGGGAGKSFARVFFPYECSAAGCPGVASVTAEGKAPFELGWPDELVEGGGTGVIDKTTEIKVRVKCKVGEAEPLNVVFSGEQSPESHNGSSAAKPSFTEFIGPGSGELTSEIGPGNTTGKDKVMGYVGQEVITAK